MKKNLEVIDKYIDNGYSGTTFERPAFKKLLEDIEDGLINTVIVKDLSRYLCCEDCGAPMMLIKGKNNAYYYCRSNRSKKICTKHTIRQTNLYNKVIDLLNIKKLDGESITELTRDIVIKYIEKVTVYENEKIDVILKYEDEIIKN